MTPGIGKNIHLFRRLKNLTQEQLGEMVGVSRQQICNYEGDKIDPPSIVLVSISNTLGVTPNDLLADYIHPPQMDIASPGEWKDLLDGRSPVEIGLLLSVARPVLSVIDLAFHKEVAP